MLAKLIVVMAHEFHLLPIDDFWLFISSDVDLLVLTTSQWHPTIHLTELV